MPDETVAAPLKIAVISVGPSAKKFTPDKRVDYDVVIGVQEVPERIPCDIWVFLDVAVFSRVTPLKLGEGENARLPKIVTSEGVSRILRHAPGFAEHELQLDTTDSGIPCYFFSGTQAAIIAMNLALPAGKRATIDAYGFDLKAQPGDMPTTPADRWSKELTALKAIEARVIKAGGKFNRVL